MILQVSGFSFLSFGIPPPGYRWGREEVVRLLEDIYAIEDKHYCLQPIVVKKRGDEYELIDGQQRLTTIYMIYSYMHSVVGKIFKKANFTIRYETREKSAEFLENIDLDRENENIDFYFMANAYRAIDDWFTEKDGVAAFSKIATHFEEKVEIIWYEVGDEEKDPIALFARLNIGKIALTSAELVKAMFLCGTNTQKISEEKKEEISFQWDNIERELHDDTLWYFLTNEQGIQDKPRIDLVLNLMAENEGKSREKYATFYYFDDKRKNNVDLLEIWRDIQHTFLILKGWRENHELYHKIGYLIASGSMSILDLFKMSKGITKDKFIELLNSCIKDSVRINDNYNNIKKKVEWKGLRFVKRFLCFTFALLSLMSFTLAEDVSSMSTVELYFLLNVVRNEYAKRVENHEYLVDDEYIQIYKTGNGNIVRYTDVDGSNPRESFRLEVVITNVSSETFTIRYNNIGINGWETSTGSTDFSYIRPGMKKKTFIELMFSEADLEDYHKMSDISVSFELRNEDYKTLKEYNIYFDFQGDTWG